MPGNGRGTSRVKGRLAGRRVTLRRPRPSDRRDRLALGRHPDIVRTFGGDSRNLTPLSPEDVATWYNDIQAQRHAWVIEHAGRCIGTARLHNFDWHQRSARYAVAILDASLLNVGLGREVTSMVLSYAFETLGLQRVELSVLAFNERAMRSFEASGFRRTGHESCVTQIDGEWHDDVIMAITRETWEAGRPGDRD